MSAKHSDALQLLLLTGLSGTAFYGSTPFRVIAIVGLAAIARHFWHVTNQTKRT